MGPIGTRGELDRPDGARIWWADDGPSDGPPVVLLHPAGRSSALWPPAWLDALAAAGLRVLRVDLRGQGRSTWEPAGRMSTLVDDTVAVLTARRVDAPVLVGVGLGGIVTQLLAVGEDSACVPRALVLAATSGWDVDPSLPGPEEAVVVALVLRQEHPSPELHRRWLLRELRTLAGPADEEDRGAWADTVTRLMTQGHNLSDGHRRLVLDAPARWEALARLDLPVSVVHGEADPLVPVAHGERLAATVPGARLRVVGGAGHHPGPSLLAAIAGELARLR